MLKEVAQAEKVFFVPVDGDDRFGTHEVCDPEPWIWGPKLFTKAHSFHPTATGQQAYADALIELLNSKGLEDRPPGFFESGMPRNPEEGP